MLGGCWEGGERVVGGWWEDCGRIVGGWLSGFGRVVGRCWEGDHHVSKSLREVGVLLLSQYSVIHLCLALQIPSYRSNVINHFFCDLPPLLSLVCSDDTVNQLVLYIVATFSEIITNVIILISYLFILITCCLTGTNPFHLLPAPLWQQHWH